MIKQFTSDHDNPQDSQLIICATGTPIYIYEQLKSIVDEMELGWSKPSQGTRIGGGVTYIETPNWKHRH